MITTCRAPACFATAAAMMPIGPAPVTSTSSPSTGNASAVCTALPNGSKMHAISGSIACLCTHTFVIGSAMYSANAPGRFTPTPLVLAQRWRRPAKQFRQRPHTTWPSPLTSWPGKKSTTFDPTSTISPMNSCPITIGTGIVRCAHSSHFRMWMSVPQIDAFFTRTRTSLMPISGTGTSSIHSPGSGLLFTRAFIVLPS